MAHGNIYPAERVDAALGNYFRPGNLGALRELALLWVADRVEESLSELPRRPRHRRRRGRRASASSSALTGAPGGERAHPPRRAHGRPARRRPGRRARRVGDGLHRTPAPSSLDAARARRELGGTCPRGRRRRRRPSAGRVRPRREGHPARARRQPAQPLARAVHGSVVARGRPRRRGRHRRPRHRRPSHADGRRRRSRPSAACARRRAPAARRRLGRWRRRRPAAADRRARRRSATTSSCRRRSSLYLARRARVAASAGGCVGVSPRSLRRCSSTGSSSPPYPHVHDRRGRERRRARSSSSPWRSSSSGSSTSPRRRARGRAPGARPRRWPARRRPRRPSPTRCRPDRPAARDVRARRGVRARPRRRGWRRRAVGRVDARRRRPSAATAVRLATTTTLELFGGRRRPTTSASCGRSPTSCAWRSTTGGCAAEAAEAAALAEVDARAHRAAARGVARPAHAAGVDQGDGHRPAAATTSTWTRRRSSHECLATIDAEADRLNRLVGNLLDCQPPADRRAGRRPAADATSTRSSPPRSAASATAAARSTSTCPRTCPPVDADPALLERAVANVVANAVRFTPPAGAGARRAGAVGDDVAPAGRRPRARASPPTSTTRSFEPFQRLGDEPVGDGRRARAGRSPRASSTAMGGDARRSTTRPAAASRVTHLPGRRRAEACRRDAAVLVVDDEPQIRRALAPQPRRPRLRRRPRPRPGRQALAARRRHHPDVVLLDLGLPGIDGIDVIEALRGWTDVPIIVLTGARRRADKVRALDAGADDYVTKPFGMAELLARLRRHAAPGRHVRRGATRC